MASYEENGRQRYYLQDELGSPLRIEDELGEIKESYGYGAFGEDLYGNQGEMQPFGYTGYQRDKVAGTYYAQAREYQADAGRFAGRDIIAGFVESPFSMNRYGYCFNSPMIFIDTDGEWPSLSDITNGIKKTVGKAWEWAKENKNNLIKIGVGIGVAAIGVGITVATGGAALPAIVAAGKAIAISGVTSAALGGGITTAKLAVRGELNEPGSWKEVAKSAWDGLADGVMWGGIMAGGTQTISAGFKELAKHEILSKEGIPLIQNKVKILSPDKLTTMNRTGNNGGTLLKIGNFHIDVISGTIGKGKKGLAPLLHMHIFSKQTIDNIARMFSRPVANWFEHFPIGTVITSIIPGIENGIEGCE